MTTMRINSRKIYNLALCLCFLASGLILLSCSSGGGDAATTPVSAPTFTSFTPLTGPVGTSVTITGTNLTGVSAVRFNGIAAATFAVVSATQATATVPPGASNGTIAVTTPGGTATSAASFTLSAPTITSFTPLTGPVGTSVTITGTNLTGATAVSFHGTAATSFTVGSVTSITVTVPAGATTGTIAVTTPGGTATSAASFTVTASATPTITSFTPGSGAVGTSVTITGTNLTGASVVAFHGTAATSFTVGSVTQITATVPSGATTGTIAVTTAGGTATSADTFTVNASTQIIANHSIVADFDKIPAEYMTAVKKMLVYFPGESHSEAYRTGMTMLQTSYPAYACNVATGEAYTDQYVRVNSYGWIGEAWWFTWYAYDSHAGTDKDQIKNLIQEYVTHGHPMHAIGFGWCWDMTRNSPSATADSVYGVHWYGSTEGGPDGDKVWGLDDGDYTVSGNNRVNMDTYLAATEDYRLYAISIGAPTKVVFTTGPADLSGESGYQGHLKHERIRAYVAANSVRILFDYADILNYNDAGVQNTTTWNGHTFPTLHNDNNGGTSVAHIGSVGAIRLAKAQWWL